MRHQDAASSSTAQWRSESKDLPTLNANGHPKPRFLNQQPHSDDVHQDRTSIKLGKIDGTHLLVHSVLRAFSPAPRALGEWQDFVTKSPKWAQVKHLFNGMGIVMFAGGSGTFPQALVSAVYLRQTLECDLPIEIWRLETEVGPTGKLENFCSNLDISLRVVGGAYSRRTTNKYTYKPAVIALSSFDKVLFLDSDAVLVRTPAALFADLHGHKTAVFWRDFWTLQRNASIWQHVGGWPGGHSEYHPSQESGILMVCKSCGGWSPLLLCWYFNFHHQLYYDAIYKGRYHGSHGEGDKDTFQVAWQALEVPFQMMHPPAVIGPLIEDPPRKVCGGTIAQLDWQRRLLVMHHNANKWRYSDWVSSRFETLGMSHFAQLQHEEEANHADGMDDLHSAEIYTYQRQGIGWCVTYNLPTHIRPLQEVLGYDLERRFIDLISLVYDSEMIQEFIASTKENHN
uniref:Uncharacterized protein n=1 Tax=Eutreptiella gymnastica TaxID=73025 RepID=A0A7S1IK31_9EUGL